MTFHLMRPEWLWCLVPAALLALYLWRQRDRSGSWRDVIAPELLPHLLGRTDGEGGRNWVPLILLGWVLACVAASGPSWKKIPQPLHQKEDALVLVLDLSYSMKSADLAPSRLDRARQKLLDLLAQRREGQTGLIAYAGDAHIVTPLTDDVPTIANLLPALDPDMMPLPGSEPAAAMEQAVELLHSAGVRRGRALLVTDGIAEDDRRALENVIRGSGLQLAILGVGTPTGAPIPLPNGGFLKDSSGAIVMPGLQEQPLRELAATTGGRYQRIQIDNSDLDDLLAESPFPERDATVALERTTDTWYDQGHLFILPLLLLVLALFRRGWVFCLLPLLLAQPQPAAAFEWQDLWLTPDQQGRQALQRDDPAAAADLFENRDWAGTAAYRSGDYEGALDHFRHSESADAWYNRGNALARSGRLDEAIEAYRESLALEPGRDDARENLALLEQLKQQQDQEQQQSNGGQQSEQDQQQGQQNQQQGNEGQRSEQAGQQGQQNQQQGNENQQSEQAGQQEQPQGEQGSRGSRQQTGDREQQTDPSGQSPAQAQQDRDAAGENPEQPPGDPQQANRQPQARQPGDESAPEGEARQAAASAQADPEQQEREQAVQQWLRRVPDDPSGLLREKFRYESRQRQQQGRGRDDETIW
ncbi:MAG: VWA domain-containing protein [Halioglobus sp.]